MYAVTGASGRLGRLVLETLLEKIDPGEVVALTRDTRRLTGIADRGVTVRAFDFDRTDTLRAALDDVERLLLISGDEIGQRERQHRAAINAAKSAGVAFIAYTSVLHADTCTIGLAGEHRATEAAVRESGLTYALLRHGWYTENYTMNAAVEIARGTVIGSAGNGRQSPAPRADYAAGDATVLADLSVADQTFEFAGDHEITLGAYAAALADISGKPVRYVDMPEAEYRTMLERAGFPGRIAAMIAEASAKSADDIMFDNGRALSKLIGRPTTPLGATLARAIGPSAKSPERSYSVEPSGPG